MDQVEIDILDTELLQSRIETLLNTLMEGTGDLARDLPKPKPREPIRKIRGWGFCGFSTTHEDLGSRYARLTYTLPNVFLVVIQPIT